MGDLREEIVRILGETRGEALHVIADCILALLAVHVGDRALRYDREADDRRDGVRKMQGAALAVLANDLIQRKP